jgi:signal transduction histidine kinase
VRRLLGPVSARTTWTRALHLAIAAWFATACALVWPGLADTSLRTLAGQYLAPLPVLALLACVPVVRRSEGVQVRALVLPRDDGISVEPATSWADRGRVLLWLVLRVQLGVLAAQLTALVVAVVWRLVQRGDLLGWTVVPAALLALPAAVVLLGSALAAAARSLLSPSAAERLAVAEARTDRLLARTRLAAELHDSIGHALTVTVLQAGAARQVAGRDPAFVDGALAAIEDSARRASAELDRVLALLREPSSGPAGSPTLDDVGALVRSAEAAGAAVDLRITGAVAALPPVVSREGYRIVQESVTNALRHAGPVPVTVAVTADPGRLVLVVENPVPVGVPAPSGTGSGVRGLQERAALLGGTASAGLVDDRWRVTVRLPLAAAG